MLVVGEIKGPSGGQDPKEMAAEISAQVPTGMSKMFSGDKAPGFQKWMEQWFGPSVTPEMVTAFEMNMMQMIQNSMKQAKEQHEKMKEINKELMDQDN